MSGHQYVYPAHVEIRETAGHRPTQTQLREEQDAAARRRARAARARHNVTGDRHA